MRALYDLQRRVLEKKVTAPPRSMTWDCKVFEGCMPRYVLCFSFRLSIFIKEQTLTARCRDKVQGTPERRESRPGHASSQKASSRPWQAAPNGAACTSPDTP